MSLLVFFFFVYILDDSRLSGHRILIDGKELLIKWIRLVRNLFSNFKINKDWKKFQTRRSRKIWKNIYLDCFLIIIIISTSVILIFVKKNMRLWFQDTFFKINFLTIIHLSGKNIFQYNFYVWNGSILF